MLDDTTHNLPATRRRLSDIVDEYESKVAAADALCAAFAQAKTDAESGACIGGTYTGSIWDRYTPGLDPRTVRKHLLESAWKHVYNWLQLDKIAPASDRDRFEMAMKDPAPFTLGNIGATFGKYIEDPRAHILRGLAEAFGSLDPAFKSHDRMKIGVKGLPKRVILSSVTPSGYGGWGTKRLEDILNALAVYCGKPRIEYKQFSAMLDEAKKGKGRLRAIVGREEVSQSYSVPILGNVMDGPLGDIWLKRFANGNGHLFFGPEMLATVNEALREHYGEVLPDCPEAAPKRAKSTAVARDLQFYRTPDAAADALVAHAAPGDGCAILEPSCGDGAILDAVRRYCERETHYCPESKARKHPAVKAMGVEVDASRAREAEAKGYSVMCRNFLEIAPSPKFDMVLMNPPFYGKHYQKHVEHALKFLKPGGRLYAILPITAVTDHGYVDPGRGYDRWQDLPAGSFADSGTNINTGIAVFHA